MSAYGPMVREYHASALEFDANMWHGLARARGALCADGKRRNAFPSGDGTADTFFSIPAYVYVGRTRVYGYVTVETVDGYTTEHVDDPATVKFVAYTYRKHHALLDARKVEG